MNKASSIQRCPHCGSRELLRQTTPQGQLELLCLDPDCHFSRVEQKPESGSWGKTFIDTICRQDRDRLRQMAHNLTKSLESLTGRSARVARRQLSLVKAELKRRHESQDVETEIIAMQRASDDPHHEIPPQFKTPQAMAKRVRGIREYYRRRKAGKAKSGNAPGTVRWFNTLLKTLRDEASRHEKAADTYARVPDLFALHIEHSAKAFELNRILILLTSYLEILTEEESEASEKE